MRNELDEMIKNMGSAPEMGYNPTAQPKNEAMGLQPDQMDSQESDQSGGSTDEETGLYETEITDQDINDVIGGGAGAEVPVDEAMGISYSNGTVVTGKLGDHDGTHGRFRQQSQNESIKLGGLIEENKKLTKKLNETKKQKDTATTLVESYKNALEKYRNQLKEMAVFNTNLAHVNNLLVNESLALTQDDKIKIINGFKKVDTITESQNKYKSILSEMKVAKKTLTESIADKVTTSVQPSSKQKLDEVIEKTAYANDKHIQRMKNIMNIIERKQQG
jgi:ActR/RegA family two-component response regulator